MKKILILLLTLSLFSPLFANNEATLVVSAEAITKDAAVQDALRYAVEQTYGVFVSSSSKLTNDQLVSDEIVSVSSGAIKKYREISCIELNNGMRSVTLEVVVNPVQLINYVSNHGEEFVKISGSEIGYNLKLKELAAINEKKAIDNLISIVSRVPGVCDYKKMKIQEPIIKGKSCIFNGKVSVYASDNLIKVFDLIISTLKSLSLTKKELTEYNKMNISYYSFAPWPTKLSSYGSYHGYTYGEKYYLRNSYNNYIFQPWDSHNHRNKSRGSDLEFNPEMAHNLVNGFTIIDNRGIERNYTPNIELRDLLYTGYKIWTQFIIFYPLFSGAKRNKLKAGRKLKDYEFHFEIPIDEIGLYQSFELKY